MRNLLLILCLSLTALSILADNPVNPDDQMAWKVFVEISQAAAAAPPNESPVAWRLWSTQSEVYPGPDSVTPGSTGIYTKFRTPLSCGTQVQQHMTTDQRPQCELVFLNQPAATYILENQLYLRSKLIAAAMSSQGIHLPSDGGNIAREIKTEWRAIQPADSSRYVVAMMTPAGSSTPQIYGLVAIHLMTHELPNWLWATWIHEDYQKYVPQSLGLHDSFGVAPSGTVSSALQQLLSTSQEPFLSHYRLIGSQRDPVKTARLGNPMIEGPNLQYASCMGCHAQASLDAGGAWTLPGASHLVGASRLAVGRHPVDFDFSLLSQAKCHDVRNCTDSVQIPQ